MCIICYAQYESVQRTQQWREIWLSPRVVDQIGRYERFANLVAEKQIDIDVDLPMSQDPEIHFARKVRLRTTRLGLPSSRRTCRAPKFASDSTSGILIRGS